MRRALLLLPLLAACLPETTVVAPRCDLVLDEPQPSSASPGDEVVLPGRPLTSTYDTAVYLGSTRATVLEVLREDCEACDDCRVDNECTECSDCDACDQLCTQDCSETIRFLVPPDLLAGTAQVTVYNLHGVGGPVSLQVEDAPDTGNTDTGNTDTGSTDTGSTDTGSTDTGSTDTGR